MILFNKKAPCTKRAVLISLEVPNRALPFLHEDNELYDGVVFDAILKVTIIGDTLKDLKELTEGVSVSLHLEKKHKDGTDRYSYDG